MNQHPDNGRLAVAVSTPIEEILSRVTATRSDTDVEGEPTWCIDAEDGSMITTIYTEEEDTCIIMHRREDSGQLPWFITDEEVVDLSLGFGVFPDADPDTTYSWTELDRYMIAEAELIPVYWDIAGGKKYREPGFAWNIFIEEGPIQNGLMALHTMADMMRAGVATPAGDKVRQTGIIKVTVDATGRKNTTTLIL